ncbi:MULTISPECIES: hydantoinase/oxoprolinase family protein [unclassified Achromobacter]|uniref:hydantoinase/oxoprolinase family protein n=1 Tax=unclassified Achromobacter TaxID=2626865 RepID=UPI001E5AB738|nr:MULTISPECIES: hydantoinase/oxoprolinase family protein [unclassified Achromobacter]
MQAGNYALGIDIGGTFTDIVVYDTLSGTSTSHKELTTPKAPYEGVIRGVRTLFEREGLPYANVDRVIHATTLFTNALIERKGALTGLITTAGFRDTLEMAREHKYELFDLHIELPRPIVPRRLRLEASERMGHDGAVQQPLDVAQVVEQAGRLAAAGVTSIAIVFLHAYANPVHERMARDAIEAAHPQLFISISSDVSPQIREFERTSTTVANAYVKPLADGYLDRMTAEIKALGIQAPLFMMLSNGGLTHVDEAKRVPIQLLESGPAAGALAGAFFGKRSHIEDVMAFDMGGTTAKLAIIDAGKPLIAHHFEASREKRLTEGSGLPISISTIELIEIGAGGGSIAHLDALGLLKVGPESASSLPGPACYGRGGTQATVTDANLVLGFLDPAAFAGGTMSIDVGKAEDAMRPLARQSDLSVPAFAWGIYSIVNENMAAAARVHVAERGHHAGKFALLLTGGGGPLHGCEVARRLGMTRAICPPGAGVASALGLLMAPARIDRMVSVGWKLETVDWAALEAEYARIEADARAVIDATLPGQGATAHSQRAADLRFAGQGFEVITDLPPGPYTAETYTAIREAFLATYAKTFGQVPPRGDIEIINLRAALAAGGGEGELQVDTGTVSAAGAARGTRRMYLPERKDYADVPVYERGALQSGQTFHGPAIVQEASSTLIVPQHATVDVDDSGSLIVNLDATSSRWQAPSSAIEESEKQSECAN